jgi:hypothetical protein
MYSGANEVSAAGTRVIGDVPCLRWFSGEHLDGSFSLPVLSSDRE